MSRTRILAIFASLTGLVSLALVSGGSTPAQSVGTFSAPVVVSGTHHDASEPGVDVASDGTVYVNAPDAILNTSNNATAASYLWRSDNRGASFALTPYGTRSTVPGGGDSDVALDMTDGTVYFSDLWLGSSSVSVSHDKGQTWVANPYSGSPVQDRQWQATPGGGRVYIVTHQDPSGLVVSRSIDGGVSYPTSTVAATPVDQGNCLCPPGTIVAEGTGALTDKVGVIYFTYNPMGIRFSRSANGGTTWTTSTVTQVPSGFDTTKGFPVVANAGSGKLVAVWMETNGGSGKRGAGAFTRVQYSSSADWGATWTAARTLAGGTTGGTPLYPWVAASGSKVSVSLFHTSAQGTPDLVASSAKWYEKYLESIDGGTTFSSLVTLDSNAVKTGPICLDGFSCSTNRELGDFQAVALDTTGRAYATWARSLDNKSSTEIRLAHQL